MGSGGGGEGGDGGENSSEEEEFDPEVVAGSLNDHGNTPLPCGQLSFFLPVAGQAMDSLIERLQHQCVDRSEAIPSSASVGLAGYSQVDMLVVWNRSFNFGAEKSPGSPYSRGQKDGGNSRAPRVFFVSSIRRGRRLH